MNNCNINKSILFNTCKAKDYYYYYTITKLYPEIKKLSEKEILIEICELYKNSIDANKNDCGVLCYQYVVHGLIPMYEEFGDREILNKCLEQLEISECTVYDCDLLRDIYVVKAKVYMLLQLFSLAEKYIFLAYNDYDYRTSTFFLLMKILDSQNKFELMIYYLKQYCIEFYKLHEKIQINDLNVINIKTSDYIDQFINIVERNHAVEC